MNTLFRSFAIVAVLSLGVSSVADAAALTAARQTASKNTGALKRYLMKASTTIYSGGMVMLNSAGTAEPAANSTTAGYVVGVATETKTSAATGSTYVVAQEGWFLFAGTTLAQVDQGRLVFAEEDQTVDETPAANDPVAGRLMEFVSASSAWIHISPDNVSAVLSDGGNGLGSLTAATTLGLADCGRRFTVTAAIDGSTITLPEASTVDNFGCTYELVYSGADAGALVDITPLDSDADGIEGSCVLAASVVTFSGTADADIGLTKASILTGDGLKLTAIGAAVWWAHDITGICANN